MVSGRSRTDRGRENVTSGETLYGESADIRGDRMLKFTAIPDQYMECTGYTVKTSDGEKQYSASELNGDVLVIDKVSSDTDVTAHFSKKELKAVITFAANDPDLGTVSAVYGTDKKAIVSGDSQIAGRGCHLHGSSCGRPDDRGLV